MIRRVLRTVSGPPDMRRDPQPFERVRPRDPAVRPLPYPYRGALALSSDAEFLGYDVFDELMRWVNTRDATRFGAGLGMEMTASLFVFSAGPDGAFSYLRGAAPDAPRSDDADRLDEYLRAGLIDTNHAFGDFATGFTRAHAERAYAALGTTLPVFTNHGGSGANLGGHVDAYRGDLPDQPAYHADLLRSAGVEFAWIDDGFNMKESDSAQPLRHRVRGRAQMVLGRLPGTRTPRRGELLIPRRLRDGTGVTTFMRLRGTGRWAPNLASFDRQVGLLAWKELYRNDGAVVLYQHFGVLDRNAGGIRPATIDALAGEPDRWLAGFRRLAAEHERGRLWVCGTARLLRYVRMVESARVDTPAPGTYAVSATPPLDGLTLYVEPGPPVRVLHDGREVPHVRNAPDETGRASVTVPVRPLPAVW
jgi:hypothetical protein